MMRLSAFILLFWSIWAHSATSVFNDGFETGTGSTIDSSKYVVQPVGGTFTRSTTDVLTGTYNGYYDLNRTDTTTEHYRAEVFLNNNKGNFNTGTEYWIGFNFKYTNWDTDASAEFGPFQIHVPPTAAGCDGSAVSVAPAYMLIQNNVMQFRTYGGVTRYSEPLIKNQWRSLVMHFIPSTTSSGLFEMWLDGIKKFSFSGITVREIDLCGTPYLTFTYLKLGVYKWDWRANRPATGSTRRSGYVDNLKIFSGTNGFNDVYTPVTVTDTTNPVPSGLVATPTENSATLTWITDEPADSSIDYGTSAGVYTQTVTNASLVTSHSVLITGLTGATTYHYRFRTKDAAGNEYIGSDHTFTTLSDVTPVITNEVNNAITKDSATITWTTTGVLSDSYVYYGTTGDVSSSTGSATLVTSHSVTLTGLSPKTHYFRKVCSTSAAPVTTCGPITTFNTKTSSGLFSDLFSMAGGYVWP